MIACHAFPDFDESQQVMIDSQCSKNEGPESRSSADIGSERCATLTILPILMTRSRVGWVRDYVGFRMVGGARWGR